jgi:hypothetical protein
MSVQQGYGWANLKRAADPPIKAAIASFSDPQLCRSLSSYSPILYSPAGMFALSLTTSSRNHLA